MHLSISTSDGQGFRAEPMQGCIVVTMGDTKFVMIEETAAQLAAAIYQAIEERERVEAEQAEAERIKEDEEWADRQAELQWEYEEELRQQDEWNSI